MRAHRLLLGRAGDAVPIWAVDFTGQTPGSLSYSAFLALCNGVLTRASVASVQTSASSLVLGIPADVARIANFGAGAGLLLECQRGNMLPISRDFSAAGWGSAGSGATVTPGYAVGPDGTAGGASLYHVSAGGYANYWYPGGSDPGRVQHSIWQRLAGGSATQQNTVGYTPGGALSYGYTIGSSWSRQSFLGYTEAPTVPAYLPLDGRDGTARGGIGPGDRDAVCDLAQIEHGGFPTSNIVTTTGLAIRYEDKWHIDSTGLVLGGRIEVALKFDALGARGEYSDDATDLSVFFQDIDNSATLNVATGKVSVTAGGSTFTTSTGATWSRGDTVDLRIACGGGSLQTVVRYAVNGGAFTTLGTSVAPQGANVSTAPIYLLSYADTFGSLVRSVKFYAPGAMP